VFVCVYISLGVCRSRGVMRKLDSYEKIETKLRSTIENLHEPRVESLHTRRDAYTRRRMGACVHMGWLRLVGS